MNAAFSQWDVADDLRSDSDLELYFQACIDADEGDGSLIRAALSDIAHARGMNNLEQATGLTSAELRRARARRPARVRHHTPDYQGVRFAQVIRSFRHKGLEKFFHTGKEFCIT